MIAGITGVEHVSTSVPDMEQAVAFMTEVLGAVVVDRQHFAGSDDDVDMVVTFNAHPEASAELVALDLHGVRMELFAYDAPDLVRTMPRNCDVGGHHVGFRVADLPAAVAELAAVPGVRILGEPTYGQLANGLWRGWVYFLTPWGLQMELAEERPEPRPDVGPLTDTAPDPTPDGGTTP